MAIAFSPSSASFRPTGTTRPRSRPGCGSGWRKAGPPPPPACSRCTSRRGSAAAPAWSPSRRSSTPATSRRRTTATCEIARSAAVGSRPPRPRRRRARPGGREPRGERLLHRLHDPGGGRLRRRRAGHGPATGAAAHHRERLRGGRGGPGPRHRLPGRPPGPRRARHGAGVRQPHLPARRPLGHQRRLHRDLRRRRRGGGDGRGRASPRPRGARRGWRRRRACSSAAPRTSWASACATRAPDHPRQGPGPVRAPRGGARGGRLPPVARAGARRTSSAGSCIPADGGSSR